MLLLLMSAVTPVLAGKPDSNKLTFNYASTGNINNRDTGENARMSITLSGTLTLGTPNYSSDWSGHPTEDRGWNDYITSKQDFGFSWSNPPEWLTNHGFVAEENHDYQVHIEKGMHEHWMDTYESRDFRWYTSKGSFSGTLVAMWSGGTAPETFSVSLTSLTVEKTERRGNMNMAGDSWGYEKWDVWDKTDNGNHEGTWMDKWQIGGGFAYHGETLQVYNNGKFTTKNKRFEGRLDFKQDKFWQDSEPYGYSIGIGGNGEFGSYKFQFSS